MKVQIEIEKPAMCGECPFYSEEEYQCHFESGTEPYCTMGYMKGDMRDQSYQNSLYEGCKLGK
jgi:hypothetical protein